MNNIATTKQLKAFEKRTGYKLGSRFQEVADGELYNLKGFPDRLVKIVWTGFHAAQAYRAQAILSKLQYINNYAVVKLHDVGTFSFINEEYGGVNKKNFNYYYVMDKLQKLPRKGWGDYGSNIKLIRDAIFNSKRLPKGIDNNLRVFIKRIRQVDYFYYDMHIGNVMQNHRGTLKVIDLESFF